MVHREMVSNIVHTNSFICTQFNGSKYFYETLTNPISDICLITVKWLNSSWSNRYYHFE